MDYPIWLDLVLSCAVVVLVWMHWHQQKRIDELWKELDAQRAWQKAQPTVTTDGTSVEVRKVR